MGKDLIPGLRKRRRKANFTNEEVEILIKELEFRREILFGELKTPQAHRDKAWAIVTEKINAVSPEPRSIRAVKHKFQDLKSRTKRKANALFNAEKSGSDQNIVSRLNPTENKVCSFIDGINSEIDNFTTEVVKKETDLEDEEADFDASIYNEDYVENGDVPGSIDFECEENSLQGMSSSETSEQPRTYKEEKTTESSKTIEEGCIEDDIQLSHIHEQLKILNQNMKRRIEIEEEKLVIKRMKLQLKEKELLQKLS